MSIAVSTIQSLIGQYPMSLFTAHQWYSDYPTNSDATFTSEGEFSGPDLPFGLIYEVHDAPSGIRQLGLASTRFPYPLATITNNAKILAGYGSTIPVEMFELDRPRGILLFHEPSTTTIAVDLVVGVFLELWGLYIDIPLITPTQPHWTAGGAVSSSYAGSLEATAYPGLSGFGAVPMDNTAYGARIDLTTLPDSYGRVDGAVTRLFGVGWVNWANGSGDAAPEFIESESHVTIAPLGRTTDALQYSLSAGIVATITFLYPN